MRETGGTVQGLRNTLPYIKCSVTKIEGKVGEHGAYLGSMSPGTSQRTVSVGTILM